MNVEAVKNLFFGNKFLAASYYNGVLSGVYL